MRAWWRGGVVAWWRGGVVAWWRGGVVAWWRGGVVAWWRGRVVGYGVNRYDCTLAALSPQNPARRRSSRWNPKLSDLAPFW